MSANDALELAINAGAEDCVTTDLHHEINCKKEEFNYELAFGQHSGVIDKSKDLFELPRYPVNESYGKAERFLTLLNTKPFPFKSFKPENKFITKFENPPKIEIEFFKEITNLEKINCFANDGGEWSKKKISFIEKNWIKFQSRGMEEL